MPVVILLGALLDLARAVPMFDDYPAILAFALHFCRLPTLGQRWVYVFAAQTGDYKLIFLHALVALDLTLTHRVHFAFLIWGGNLLGFGIAWILWRICFPDEPDLHHRLILFLPVVFLFFTMSYVENFDWAMCGLQTFPAVFFSLLALDQVTHTSSKAVALACLCACLASFASSNGFLVAPLGCFLYLRRRAWLPLATWTATLALAGSIYRYGYKPVPNIFHNENTTPSNQILFFFSFLGSAVENQHRQPVKYGAVVLGVLLTAICLWALLRRFYRINPAVCSMAVWVVLTTLPVLVFRLPAGFQYSLLIRYKIYSDLLLIFAYTVLATSIRSSLLLPSTKRTLYATALGISACLCLASDAFGYKFLHTRQQRVALGLNTYAHDSIQSPQISVSGDPIDANQNEKARLTLNQSLTTGIYQLPPEARR